jgi:membrane fusion protein
VTLPAQLFRQEAIEFQNRDREWGRVVLLQPVSIRALGWSLTTATAVIITFLCFAQYARKETVSGYLTPSAGTAKIFTPQQGTIKNVHIVEGEQVNAGQPLLTVETPQIATDGQDTYASMLATLNGQRARLIRQMAAEELRTVSERERLRALIRGTESEIAHLKAQIDNQTERIKLTKSFVTTASQLNAKGYMADIEYKRRQQEVLEQEQSLNLLNQNLASRENQLTEIRYTLEQLPTVMSQKVQLLRNDVAENEQRIADINSRRAYVIRAPTAGRVTTLQATVGQTADPQHLQLEILPTDSVLQAELFIPSRAIGFVQIGQPVRLLYEAFPYQKFGTYRGHIIKLSQTVLTGRDISAPLSLKEPAYKATVALERISVDTDDRTIPLQADMLLTADIIIEKRAIISWLFNPLFSATKILDLEDLNRSFLSLVTPFLNARDAVTTWLKQVGILRHDSAASNPKSPDPS